MTENINGRGEYSRGERTYFILGALASQKETMTIKQILDAIPNPVVKSIVRQHRRGYHPELSHWRSEIAGYYMNRDLIEIASDDSRRLQLTDSGKKLHNSVRDKARDDMPESIILGEE
jgi:hypothetical protein